MMRCNEIKIINFCYQWAGIIFLRRQQHYFLILVYFTNTNNSIGNINNIRE